MLEVIKRNGERVPFDRDKITVAIEKAMNSSSGIYEEGQAAKIAGEIEAYAASIQKDLTIYAIEDQVYYRLLKYNNPATARAYENYKTIQAFKRQTNTTDDDVFGLLNNTNLEVLDENSNKNGHVVSTQRDLIADIDPMLNQIRKLTPYLQADGVLATTAEGKVDVFEYLQNPEQLAKYELLSNCIACGVCEGACPVYAGGDAFIGPAALIWASRFVNDSRDTKAMERMDAIDTADGVAACQSVRACSRHCPRGIDVGEEMWQIVAKVRER